MLLVFQGGVAVDLFVSELAECRSAKLCCTIVSSGRNLISRSGLDRA